MTRESSSAAASTPPGEKLAGRDDANQSRDVNCMEKGGQAGVADHTTGKNAVAGKTRSSDPNDATDQGALDRLRQPLSPTRLIALVVLIAPIVGLGVARYLTPNTDGLGTHRQLGLPPCSMRVLFGIRCPGCGMTTSWAHFTRGEWAESVSANVAGFMLALFAIWIASLAARTVHSGRVPRQTTQTAIAITAAGIFLVSLTQWAYRLWLGG